MVGVSRNTILEWRRSDPEFQKLLSEAEEEVIAGLRAEAVDNAMQMLKDLMPEVSRVLTEALQGGDRRTALQAASIVLRYAGAEASSSTGLESALRQADVTPGDGD